MLKICKWNTTKKTTTYFHISQNKYSFIRVLQTEHIHLFQGVYDKSFPRFRCAGNARGLAFRKTPNSTQTHFHFLEP